MAVQITIRGASEEVRDELATQAALNRQSMQEYVRGELERIAARPPVHVWLQEVRSRTAAAGTAVLASLILEARHSDRRRAASSTRRPKLSAGGCYAEPLHRLGRRPRCEVPGSSGPRLTLPPRRPPHCACQSGQRCALGRFGI